MEIQNNLNTKIKWQQLTAKEIQKYQQEGQEVPSEFQKWAAAISAVLTVNDDVTYEMTNGETDIAALEETLGKEFVTGEITPTDETENNIGNENEETEEETDKTVIQSEPDKVAKEDPTLANDTINTDPNEILKRKQRKGIQR